MPPALRRSRNQSGLESRHGPGWVTQCPNRHTNQPDHKVLVARGDYPSLLDSGITLHSLGSDFHTPFKGQHRRSRLWEMAKRQKTTKSPSKLAQKIKVPANLRDRSLAPVIFCVFIVFHQNFCGFLTSTLQTMKLPWGLHIAIRVSDGKPHICQVSTINLDRKRRKRGLLYLSPDRKALPSPRSQSNHSRHPANDKQGTETECRSRRWYKRSHWKPVPPESSVGWPRWVAAFPRPYLTNTEQKKQKQVPSKH